MTQFRDRLTLRVFRTVEAEAEGPFAIIALVTAIVVSLVILAFLSKGWWL